MYADDQPSNMGFAGHSIDAVLNISTSRGDMTERVPKI